MKYSDALYCMENGYKIKNEDFGFAYIYMRSDNKVFDHFYNDEFDKEVDEAEMKKSNNFEIA